MMLKQLRIAKKYGVWYYRKITPDDYNDLDAPIWELFNSNQENVGTFGCYSDMIYYIHTGIII